jgi:hypothetical protein
MTPSGSLRLVEPATLRQELLRHRDVQRLLGNSNWRATAEAALRFCVDGIPTSVPGWAKTKTWQQVCAACSETQNRLQNQTAATSQSFTGSYGNCRGGQPITTNPQRVEVSRPKPSVGITSPSVISPSARTGPHPVTALFQTVAICSLGGIVGAKYGIWAMLAVLAGGLFPVFKQYWYAHSHGSWNAGMAALMRDEAAKREARHQAKWAAYREDCRMYTPEERYWRRFWQRQGRYAFLRLARKR